MHALETTERTSTLLKLGVLARSIAGRGKRLFFSPRDYVVYRGNVLPASGLRFNGADHQDDEIYLASAVAEARRVTNNLGYDGKDLLVDIGCGQGRLPLGLLQVQPRARYLGLDVCNTSIQWCNRHIARRFPSYEFAHLDVMNARYNPSGKQLKSEFQLPIGTAEAAIVYMWGVVTNMEPEHLPTYAREIGRILRPGGKLFLTANVEQGVPTVSINPENYTSFACKGPLHIVRYERDYFVDLFRDAGLSLSEYAHHAAGNCQSDMYFLRE